MSHRQAALAAAVASLVASTAAIGSCGSAFCMVNTNWGVQGVWNEPGFRGDLRLEYIDQDQPRSGSRNVGVGEIPHDHDEVRTLNRNVFATLDYGISAALGVSVILPWVDREHEHIHNGEDGPEPESWNFSGLGDMRVVGRYQFAPTTTDPQATRVGFAGVTGGLKLPTGRTTVANGEGEVAERTLQPGTGTTDALLGAYYREALGSIDASWFAQVNLQFPLDSYRAFRPGRQVLVDVGGRWDATDKVGLMLQLNALWKARDSGAQAEPDDSGSRTVSLSPGFTYALTPTFQVYAFVQVPVYQHVNGVQLVADRSYAVGVSAQF